MSNRDDGGSAFPSHEQWNEWSDLKAEYMPRTGPKGGMTLRDYFAAQALAVMSNTLAGDGMASMLAKRAYSLADALLAERSK